ncbi:MAG: putative metal-binding motif-containing protein [Pseudomonadota bacterium]|nr:putative metal-binding motif-containing protein [Pseudomonadota bacterium]
MSKSVLLTLALPLGVLTGCISKAPDYLEIRYPVMTLGQASMEFGVAEWGGSVERSILLANEGDMVMGVGSVGIGNGLDVSAFTVTWDAALIECDDVVAEAGAKEVDVDTGDGPDTGAGADDSGDAGEEALEGALFVLAPGCQVPLVVTYTPATQGDAYDALIVESVGTPLTNEQEDEGQDLPDFSADPVHTRQVVYLHGESEFEQGALVVQPRSYDFGFVHPDATDEEPPARIRIANVGDSPVTILRAELAPTCEEEGFTLAAQFEAGRVLEGQDATLAEVTFTPLNTSSSSCQLSVYTDDVANPRVDVTLIGNAGDDPENAPPTAYVRSPENGYRYSTIRPLTLELNIFDENQPATSLECKVKSLLAEGTVASCTAADESGHVYVVIPAEDLEPGVDTLLVTVTDGSDVSAYASISVVINSDYPADDDDGDGYGVASEPADCDDSNILSYPNAAEVFDGQDNDCDGVSDEGTDGFDDDGDGVAEVDGDCNDFSIEVYPGAPERGDALDNDCDGTVDEGTSYYDDDGDGYSEVNNDCNDLDATINPGAIETCDRVDNDCDSLIDSADGCEPTDSDPAVVGDTIRMSQSACHELEVVKMDLLVFDADQDTISYEWSTDDDGGTFDNIYAQVVHYTAPEVTGDTRSSNHTYKIYALINDDDGNQDWAFGELLVWDAKAEIYEPFAQALPATGCASTGGGPAGALLVAGAALALAFRRRE